MLYRMEMVPELREAKNEGLAMIFVKYFSTFFIFLFLLLAWFWTNGKLPNLMKINVTRTNLRKKYAEKHGAIRFC